MKEQQVCSNLRKTCTCALVYGHDVTQLCIALFKMDLQPSHMLLAGALPCDIKHIAGS